MVKKSLVIWASVIIVFIALAFVYNNEDIKSFFRPSGEANLPLTTTWGGYSEENNGVTTIPMHEQKESTFFSTTSTESACTPEAPYSFCVKVVTRSDSFAIYDSTLKIQWQNKLVGTNTVGSFYVGRVTRPYKITIEANPEDKTEIASFYTYLYLDSPYSDWGSFWSGASCTSSGCSGGQSIPAQGEMVMAEVGQTYYHCPTLVGVARIKRTYSGGTTSHTVKIGTGWLGNTNCIRIYSVACYSDGDCSSGLYCDTSGAWQQWSCKTPECNNGQTKCDASSNSYVCENRHWVNKGALVGKCNYYNQSLQLAENQLVVMETFVGGSTISKTSTRYPVIVWGGTLLPVIKISSVTNTVSTDMGVYTSLDAGSVLQIPSTEVWSLFYVIENNYQLPTICSIVDVATKQCAKVNAGIITACSVGQFDPSTGLCVVQANASQYICPEGGRFDVSIGKCIWHPSLQDIICPATYAYEQASDKCVKYPITENRCESGVTYNPSTGRCEISPPTTPVCLRENSTLTDLGNGNYACIYSPTAIPSCPSDTIYDSARDVCSYTPITSGTCTTGYIFNQATNTCDIPLQPNCVQGTYSLEKNACLYTPNLEYLCIDGTIISDQNGTRCEITPNTEIVCATGFEYDAVADKCTKYPDNICIGGTFNPITGECEVDISSNVYLWYIVGASILIIVIFLVVYLARRRR